MSSDRKGAGAVLAADAELMQAGIELCQQLELHDQLRVVVRKAVEWSGARGAVALAPGEERSTWSPLVANAPADDAVLAELGAVEPQRVRSALRTGTNVFDGLGPFDRGTPGWSTDVPTACAVLPVHDQTDDWAALVLLLFDAAPAADRLERTAALLELVRPAVTNALQVAAMRELVIKDDTAHCFNRRYFESSLPDEIARASRFHASLSLIFLDMDNLKEVNNRFGHAMGSQTLREVSSRVRVKIRRFDKLFRFGGDEFCIVLPETEWHGALEVAERVRDAIASKPFLLRELEGGGVRMTASLGIASYPLHATTQRDLIEHADRAMQRIKSGTKNSIGIAEIAGEHHGE